MYTFSIHVNSDQRVKPGFWECTQLREHSLYQDVSSIKKGKFTKTPEEGFTTHGPNTEGKGTVSDTRKSMFAHTEAHSKRTGKSPVIARTKNGFGAGNGMDEVYSSWVTRQGILHCNSSQTLLSLCWRCCLLYPSSLQSFWGLPMSGYA